MPRRSARLRAARANPALRPWPRSMRDRFHRGIAAAGPGLGDILWRVVCAGESVPVAEQALGWPVRAGRLVLTLALDRVADYYNING